MTDPPDRPAPDRRKLQTTEDVENYYSQNPRGHQKRRASRVGPAVLVIIGWLIMIWALSQPLLASLQAIGIGLGLLISAVLMAAWQGQNPGR
jgi:hypothetical protein